MPTLEAPTAEAALCDSCKHHEQHIDSPRSQCNHPHAPKDELLQIAQTTPHPKPMGVVLSSNPVNHEPGPQLDLKYDSAAVKRGEFEWPYNYIAAHLTDCSGYDRARKRKVA